MRPAVAPLSTMFFQNDIIDTNLCPNHVLAFDGPASPGHDVIYSKRRPAPWAGTLQESLK